MAEVTRSDDVTENHKMGTVNKIFNSLAKTNPTKQLFIGAASGWVTGYVTMKVGKTAAFGAGGTVILVQLAQNHGLLHNPWDKVREKAVQTRDKLAKDPKFGTEPSGYRHKVKTFAKDNTPFTAGFVGGFLLGAAM